MSYGTMPHGWVQSGVLKEFSAREGVVGRSIAALKAYLAIAAYREWDTGSCVLSTFDLTKVCGVSKPTALEGVALLQAMGLIDVDARAAGNVNRYALPGFSYDGFRKVPQDRVIECLPRIGNRGGRHLDALKLYFVMLLLREEQSSKAVVSHVRLIEYSGVRPECVAAANGVLAACGFIHIRTSDEWSRTGHPTNEYELLGDFKGAKRKRRRPIEERRTPPWLRND